MFVMKINIIKIVIDVVADMDDDVAADMATNAKVYDDMATNVAAHTDVDDDVVATITIAAHFISGPILKAGH